MLIFYANTSLCNFVKIAFLKITDKSTHFFPPKKIPILRIEIETNKTQRSQNLTSKHRAVKNLFFFFSFQKNVNKDAKNKFFSPSQ